MDAFVFWTKFDPNERFKRPVECGVGGAFNQNKTSELHNLEILKWKKENKKLELSNSEIKYLVKFPSYVTRVFCFHFFILKFSSNEKLAMTS